MDKLDIENKIKEEIEDIRPFLNMDGGDILFIKYEDGRYIVVDEPEDARPKRRKSVTKKTTEEPEEESEE